MAARPPSPRADGTIRLRTGLPFTVIIRPCPFREYRRLAEFHYRAGPPGPVSHTFGLYARPGRRRILDREILAGVIVYSMPPIRHGLRNIATGGRFLAASTRSEAAAMVNREVRTISRVIIHPRFRSIGLARRLVRRTMPLPGTRFIEASAVMGAINPFFVKAGMTMFTAPPGRDRQRLLAAFEHVGIPADQLPDITGALALIEKLPPRRRAFLLEKIDTHYVRPRRAVFSSKIRSDPAWLMPRIVAWIRQRPAYFIWENPIYRSGPPG